MSRTATPTPPTTQAVPCCLCGTTGGRIQRCGRRPDRFRIEADDGTVGLACARCHARERMRVLRAARRRGPQPPSPRPPAAIVADEPPSARRIAFDRLNRRAWKRARAARLLEFAARKGLTWREARRYLDLTATTAMRRATP